MKIDNQKFNLGNVYATKGVMEKIPEDVRDNALKRHALGDWGELSNDDKILNDEAIKIGENRVFSAYIYNNIKFWIITEWDRSATTILLPDEY